MLEICEICEGDAPVTRMGLCEDCARAYEDGICVHGKEHDVCSACLRDGDMDLSGR